MDDVLPMVNNMKAHIARVEAELAQARETIVLMSEAALSQQQEIARLRGELGWYVGRSHESLMMYGSDHAIRVLQETADHD